MDPAVIDMGSAWHWQGQHGRHMVAMVKGRQAILFYRRVYS